MALELIDGVDIPESFDLPNRQTLEQKKQDDLLFEKAKRYIEDNNIFLIAHYYTSDTMQKLAESTGGFIGDSLEMAKQGKLSDKKTIIVAGVRFMGESAKILSADKTVLMPNLNAQCSLDLCCNVSDLKRIKQIYKDYTIVAYANTSAEVKAHSDWIVTSSLAVELSEYLSQRGDKILWLPDRHLGSYIQRQSGADVLCWPGRCIVHDAFEANSLKFVLQEHPNAKILVHPEAPYEVVKIADFVGSTSQILNYAKNTNAKELIIATERNIFYKISQACPDKTLIQAPVASVDNHCISCANCPWMELNTLSSLIDCIENPKDHEIFVDDAIRQKALIPLDRMLKFASYLSSGQPIPKEL